MLSQSLFAELKFSKIIWAIGSIHSHLNSFESIKEHILKYFSKGDKLIFLGNIIGLGKHSKETLSSVINMVNHPHCGTLPDFGNFYLGTWEDKGNDYYDRYLGMEELMPYAKAVSAKSNNFNENGTERDTDYYKMINIVLSADYSGYVGIEYEGSKLDEMAGIKATKDLLEKVRDSL